QQHAILLRVLEPVTAPSVLEHEALREHGDRLGEEHHADEEQQELRLEHYGHGPEPATEREGARISHEDLRRKSVVPQEPHQRTCHGGAVDRELARVLEIEDAEVATRVDAADQVREDGQGGEGNRGGT